MQNKKAFTLVELIVVITILAILGTIAFVSLQGYSKDARNSVRVSDGNNIELALELFSLQVGKYPAPSNKTEVLSGSTVLWYTGTIGDSMITQLEKLGKKPVDPKSEAEYTYSTTVNSKEYQLKVELEDSLVSNSLVGQAQALEAGRLPRVNGTYNDLYLVDTLGNYYAAPSLFMNGTTFDIDGQQIEFTPVNLGTKPTTSTGYINFVTALQNVYNTGATKNLATYNLINTLDPSKFNQIGDVLVNGGKKVTSTSASSVQSCTNGYTGINCEIAPVLITTNDCTSAGWIWVADTQDVYIGSNQGTGFCISPRIGDFSDSTGGGISFNGWGNVASGDRNGWDTTSIDDSGNSYAEYGQTKRLDSSVGYTCKSLGSSLTDFDTSDTIAGRMKWLATNKANLTELQDIEWVQNAIPPNSHPIPALYIADCIDGVKDLGTDMAYKHYPDENLNETITYAQYSTDVTISTETVLLTNITYQNRQKYLTAWTQKIGSHLPSAMSYITSGYASASDADGDFLTTTSRGEYQVACEASLLTDANDDIDNEEIWVSAIGYTNGAGWGRDARFVGSNGCGDQAHDGTGGHTGTYSARFVVRP